MSKVIWQKAALPSYHSSWRWMDSSDLVPHLIHGSLDPLESAPRTASRSVQLLLPNIHVRHTDKHTQTRPTIKCDIFSNNRLHLCITCMRCGIIIIIISENTGEVRETSFLFQRCSVLVQRFNAILLYDSLPAYDCTDWFFVPIFVFFQ